MENETLKNIPLFSELSQEELKELSNSSVKKKYPKGSIVIYKGDLAQHMFLILKGRVKVILNGHIGNEVILGMLEPGSYFGETSVFDAMPHSATIVTVEESDFLCISQEHITNLIKKKPEIALEMLSELSKKLRETHEQVGNRNSNEANSTAHTADRWLSEDAEDLSPAASAQPIGPDFFPGPIQFYLQLAYLTIQLRNKRFVLLLGLLSLLTENMRKLVQHLTLPLRDLVRMDPITTGDLRQRALVLQRF